LVSPFEKILVMKNLLICLMLFCFLMSCEKSEVSPKTYPYVLMKEVHSSSEGAEFIAEITDLGEVPINRYGFIWSKGTVIDSNMLFSKEIDSEIRLGQFSLWVTSDLEEEVYYTVRPFIETQSQLVLGNSILFQGRGAMNAEFIDFAPKSGDSGDTITITGANFSLSKSRVQVFLGADQAIVHSVDFEEIRFVVPENLSKSGEVTLSFNSGDFTFQGNEPFFVEGQQITDFNPKEGIIGETEVTITGDGFLPSGNIVRIGGKEAIILEEEASLLKVQLPYSMEVGKASIEVDVNGKLTTSVDSFEVRSRWIRLNDFPEVPRVGGYFTMIGNEGYLIGGVGQPVPGRVESFYQEIWKYDFSLDEWTNIGSFPGLGRWLAVGFNFDQSIYFGLGKIGFGLYDFWKYEVQTNTWTQLGDFPGYTLYDAIFFTLKGLGYVIGGRTQLGMENEVWRFDPSIESWELLGTVPTTLASELTGQDLFFQSEDKEKAYILPTSNTTLFEFDPENVSFLKPVSEVPMDLTGREGRLFGFVIENELFIGGDDYYKRPKAENPSCWKYDISSGVWTRIESFLGGERNYVNSFSRNGTGYVMFGRDRRLPAGSDYKVFPEVWVYDPSR
jgi:N-acetylneuraminic acid mutarotase